MWGKGLYFTENASYADTFSRKRNRFANPFNANSI